MCLGVPAQIVSIEDATLGTAIADTGGVQRIVNIGLLDLQGKSQQELIGSYVLVHVGFAMAIIDEQEAIDTLTLLQQMSEDSE